MRTDPLVSIIINNFNYGRFLGRAIDSALAQTHPATEVIVVDDGSTDSSREVISTYGERVIPILKENGGQASAMNAGFKCSRGDVVIFLDSDDVLMPQTAGFAVAAFEARGGTAKVQYRMAIIDDQGRPTGEVQPPTSTPLPEGDLRCRVVTFPFDMTWMATSGNAFSRRALERIFPVPEADFRILADFYLSHLAPLFGRVVSLDEVGACYRVHASNHYASAGALVDPKRVRQTVESMRATNREILKAARSLGLDPGRLPSDDILSVSYMANRVLTRKLAGHAPRQPESLIKLLWRGLLASSRRFDVPRGKRLIFMAWFLAATCAPRGAVPWLAEIFFFPQRRGVIGRLLGLPTGTSAPANPVL